MGKRIKYTDEPLGELKVIDDFLPTPDELAVKEENVKAYVEAIREYGKAPSPAVGRTSS